jgi:hypothetical protein
MAYLFKANSIHSLGAFAKLWKRLLSSSRLSVCPSVCPNGATRLPLDRFVWNLIFEHFSKCFRKVQAELKSDKHNGYFTWRPINTFFIVSRWVLLRIKNILHISYRENQNTFLYSIFFFLKSGLYEIMWKNTVQRGRPYVHWMLDTYGCRHTLRISNTYCFSTASMVTRKRLNVTLYVYGLSSLLWFSMTSRIGKRKRVGQTDATLNWQCRL